MTNTQILAFILGYQGGTVHQIAYELGVSVDAVLDAEEAEMQTLCRKAQGIFLKRGGVNGLLVKHLGMCVSTLKADYGDHGIPAWLERAAGVLKIISEEYPVASGLRVPAA